MHFFQFEQHMADTAHKKRLQKLEAFSKQTFSFHFQTFFSNIFFNILDLILQIANRFHFVCKMLLPSKLIAKTNGHENNHPQVPRGSQSGEKARATRVSMLENFRRAFSLFSFFRALGLRRWK